MKLSDRIVSEDIGAVLELNDLDGSPLMDNGKRVTITLAPTASRRWQKALDTVGNRVIKTANPRSGVTHKTMEEQRSDTAFLLASVTLAWDGIELDDGSTQCTFDNAKKLYLDPTNSDILKQVDDFLGEQRNFMKASAKN